jgi:hypothetical protein
MTSRYAGIDDLYRDFIDFQDSNLYTPDTLVALIDYVSRNYTRINKTIQFVSNDTHNALVMSFRRLWMASYMILVIPCILGPTAPENKPLTPACAVFPSETKVPMLPPLETVKELANQLSIGRLDFDALARLSEQVDSITHFRDFLVFFLFCRFVYRST